MIYKRAITPLKFLASFIVVASLTSSSTLAQQKDFTYHFFGLFRNDIFFNSRQSVEGMEGAFYQYPKGKLLDPNGKDLNAVSSTYFYNANTRFGVNLTGPNIGKAKTEGTIELDMRGNASNICILRMKQAFINLNWGKSSLLIGQTFHIISRAILNELLNISSGAPFQPRGFAPQIMYQYQNGNILMRAGALWQSLSPSMGPNGKNRDYLKNSKIPELAASIEYVSDKKATRIGALIHFFSIVPRLQSEKGFKVDERVNALSLEAHASYRKNSLYIAGRSLLSQNLTQLINVGGYGVTSVDPTTGESKYSPLRFSQNWLNVMYGKKWRGGIFVGFIKNLGATKDVSNLVGQGTNIDKMTIGSGQLTYNVADWKFGVEYSMTTVWYGEPDKRGKAINTYDVTNHRLCGTVQFSF